MPEPTALAGWRRGQRTSGCRWVVPALVAALVGVATLGSAALAATAQWNVARVGAPEATGTEVVVAVVDTGVDSGHPAFGDRVLPQLDFTGDREHGDPQGHGTHVAGTVAGGTIDCGQGPTAIGVAPGVRILPVRVLDAEGSGRVSDVVAGIRAAADRGAEVINLSLGGDLSFLDGGGAEFRRAISYAWSKGSIPVLAAGNSGLLGGIFGSGYGGLDAVVVTGTTKHDRKAGYASSVGSAKWGIAAPGGDGSGRLGDDVLSAHPDQRCAVQGGTSMAAPHVSGALAVLRSHGLGPGAAVDRVLDSAEPIGPSSVYGAGLLDLEAAVAPLDLEVEVSDAGTTPSSAPAAGSDVVVPATTTVPAPPSSEPTETTTETTAQPAPATEPVPSTVEAPATTVEIEPAAGEVAGAPADGVDADESPAVLLVAAALGACVATSAATWRLHRLVRQP